MAPNRIIWDTLLQNCLGGGPPNPHLRDGDTPPTPSTNSLYVLGSPDRTVFYAKHIEVIDGLGKNRKKFQLEIRYVIRTCGEIPIHTSERF